MKNNDDYLVISALPVPRERVNYMKRAGRPDVLTDTERRKLAAHIDGLALAFRGAAVVAQKYRPRPTHDGLRRWYDLMLGGQIHARRAARVAVEARSQAEKRIAHDLPKRLTTPTQEDYTAVMSAAFAIADDLARLAKQIQP